MRHPCGIAFVLAFGALVASCTQDPKPAAYQFVEWVQVQGSCQEDHATQGGHYSGELVEWRNKATGVSSRYGSVENWALTSVEAMDSEIQHPNRYHPPFSVEFRDIAANGFQSQTLLLHGLSDDPNHGGGYETTCKLNVQRRLDHPPSDKERKEWAGNLAAGSR